METNRAEVRSVKLVKVDSQAAYDKFVAQWVSRKLKLSSNTQQLHELQEEARAMADYYNVRTTWRMPAA